MPKVKIQWLQACCLITLSFIPEKLGELGYEPVMLYLGSLQSD